MATATSSVIKPDHGAQREHFIFTDEHEELRESMKAWVLKELTPHRFEWEENLWPDSVLQRAGELGFLGLCYPGGVRRPGRRLLLLAGPRRLHELLRLRRAQHGLRGPHRHGDTADPPARHRGPEAALPGALDQGRADQLPRDHRARRRLRRRRHPHHREARRRRVRDQRLQDVHHQRPARQLHRPGREDRPGCRPRRDQPLHRRHPRHERQRGRGLQRLPEAREDGDARLRHRRALLRGRSRPRREPARRGGQGLLPHLLGAPGRAPGRRDRLRLGRRADVRDAPSSTPRSARPSAARSATSRRSATSSPRCR